MRARAVLYMAVSGLGFSVMAMFVKVASADLPTGEIVLVRAILTLALSYAMVRRAGVASWGTQRGKLVVRGLLGFGGLAGFYLSIAHLPLAEAATLQHTIPVWTALLAWWILREPVGWGATIALACGMGGVVLVSHPTGAGADPFGIACALAGALMSASAYVTVRQLSTTEHPLVIVLYFPLVATPLAIPWAAAGWVWPTASGWLVLAGLGVATQVGQVYLTKGLAIERAGRASSVGYLQIVFAIFWQLVVFGEWPSAWTIAGASLIIAGTLVVSATASAGSPLRTRT